MKKLFYLLVLAMVAIGFYGCEEEKEIKEELTIKEGVLDLLKDFAKEESSKDLEFKASHAWEITGTAEWITIAPKTGAAGDAVVKISVTANETLDNRQANITLALVGTTKKEEITIVQKQTDALVGDEEPINLTLALGTFSIEIKHNADYKVRVVEGADWVRHAPKVKALVDAEEEFSYTANATDAERTAKIEISGEGVTTLTYNVVQDFEGKITFNEDDIELLKDIQSAGDAIELKFNATHAWEITEDADWLTVAPMEGDAGDMTVTITATKNELTEPRTATIKISEEEVTITQEAGETAIIWDRSSASRMNFAPGTKTATTAGLYTKSTFIDNVVFNEAGMLISFERGTKGPYTLTYDAQNRLTEIQMPAADDNAKIAFEYGDHGKYINVYSTFNTIGSDGYVTDFSVWLPYYIKDLTSIHITDEAYNDYYYEIVVTEDTGTINLTAGDEGESEWGTLEFTGAFTTKAIGGSGWAGFDETITINPENGNFITYVSDLGFGTIMTQTYNDDRINTQSGLAGGYMDNNTATYNDSLDLATYTDTDDDADSYTVSYVRDAKGNWTTMTRVGGGAEVVDRTIAYF